MKIAFIIVFVLMIILSFAAIHFEQEVALKKLEIKDLREELEKNKKLFSQPMFPEIRVEHPKVIVLHSKLILTREQEQYGVTEEQVEKELVKLIAKEIEPYVSFVNDIDIVKCQKVYVASLRVLER